MVPRQPDPHHVARGTGHGTTPPIGDGPAGARRDGGPLPAIAKGDGRARTHATNLHGHGVTRTRANPASPMPVAGLRRSGPPPLRFGGPIAHGTRRGGRGASTQCRGLCGRARHPRASLQSAVFRGTRAALTVAMIDSLPRGGDRCLYREVPSQQALAADVSNALGGRTERAACTAGGVEHIISQWPCPRQAGVAWHYTSPTPLPFR